MRSRPSPLRSLSANCSGRSTASWAVTHERRDRGTHTPKHPALEQLVRPIKQIDAGRLDVGYADAGPSEGPPVLLLHGWPYDIHSYVDVTPRLAAEGYRVIVPYLRGYGTRASCPRHGPNGQQAAIALDASH